MTNQNIVDNPDQWIITKKGDFVRIKDSEIQVDKKLEIIRQKLSSSGCFKGKTSEQISKERYDKVWEEVNFDMEKLHEWLYEEKNKDKVEIVKLEGTDFTAGFEALIKHVKSSKQKWRSWEVKKPVGEVKEGEGTHENKGLINEETGQVIYSSPLTKEKISDLYWEKYNGYKTPILIDIPTERAKKWENGKHVYNSVIIFLHGTYGSRGVFEEIEQKFPSTKIIYPNSPILQYDMWHGSKPAPGSQCEGWINITGDAHELMDKDVCPDNPPPKKNFEEADKIIHLDYPQLRRATNYVNDIIEGEIASGIPSEKIFVAGYSQGGLLTLAVALTSQHKLGGFISLCGLLPRWDKLLVKPSEKNKKTPCLIINNTKDPWVPFWTGKKSYDLLKERGYNVEFKTHPGLGHSWKNEDVIEFLEKCLAQRTKKSISRGENRLDIAQKIILAIGIIGIMVVICLIIFRRRKKNFA